MFPISAGIELVALRGVSIVLSQHLTQHPHGPGKVLGIHPSLPSFIRLAYEWLLPFAWETLPISGMLELGGVLVFVNNIVLTFLLGRSAFAIKSAAERSLRNGIYQ